MKKILTTLIIIFFTVSNLYAGVHPQSKWLKQKYEKLKKIKNIKKVKNCKLQISKFDIKSKTYRYFLGESCKINFKDNSWVIIISHSMHAEDMIGDITIIRASNGKYYINRGHVCDKLILNSKSKITSLSIFLKSTGWDSAQEPTYWKEYKIRTKSMERTDKHSQE